MPELPEVETTRRGLESELVGQKVESLEVRNSKLRWPVSTNLPEIENSKITQLSRRSKYLLLQTSSGTALIHLGMSGSLRLCPDAGTELRKHDHILLTLKNGQQLRYHDPRRFGSWHWFNNSEDPIAHPLLQKLGPEPLSKEFNINYFNRICQKKKKAIKLVLMDAQVVVGIGNIYACEALFLAGIDPRRAANRIARPRLEKLVHYAKQVLQNAIDQGGTTLRDFVNGAGEPGYFAQQLHAYGREGQACTNHPDCPATIQRTTQAQRSTWWCPQCQK